jgi:hypothetical protein
MRQRRTALKHVLSWERVQGSVGEPPQSQRQGPKPDRPTQPTIPALVSPDGGDPRPARQLFLNDHTRRRFALV